MVALYIFLALLVFGVMILVHELGHFIFAKIFKVAINEFSIGMGPKIFSKKLKDDVQYSLRAFPIGGFVAMEGENEESDNPNSFDKKPAYQRFIIVSAGAIVNIIVAIIIVFILTLTSASFGSTSVALFEVEEYQGLYKDDVVLSVENESVATADELKNIIASHPNQPLDFLVNRNGEEVLVNDVTFPHETINGKTLGKVNFILKSDSLSFVIFEVDSFQGLTKNDKILFVDGKKISSYDKLSYTIMMDGNKPVDVLVERDGKEVLVKGVTFPTEEKDGLTYGMMNFKVWGVKKTFFGIIKNTVNTSISTVRMIWDSLIGLLTGKYGFKQISGPVGVTGAMVDVGTKNGPRSFLFLVAVISMNLGVFNLLPIPALDGGTLLFTGIEMIFRRRIPKKIEDTLKLIVFALLILLVIAVSIKDVIMLII